MDELQNYVLQRDAVEYVLDEFGNHVKSAFANLSNQMAQMRERKQKLEAELRRLAAAFGNFFWPTLGRCGLGGALPLPLRLR